MRSSSQRASWFLGLALAASAAGSGGGCASSPTVIDITVSADMAVPSIVTLRVTMVQPIAPGITVNGLFRSLLVDTDAGAEPFRFPAQVTLGVPAAVDGEATLTVEGIDYLDNERLLASGTATATVRRESTVAASVLLHPASGPSVSASAPDAGSGDAAAAAP